jgi:1-pyrroline-5-carboxylate dehydrogenase
MEAMDALTSVPLPVNEPVRSYAPGSAERASLETRLKEISAAGPVDLTMTIAGEQIVGEGEPTAVVEPHRHSMVLGHTCPGSA